MIKTYNLFLTVMLLCISSACFSVTITTSSQFEGSSKDVNVIGGELYEIAFTLNKQSTTGVRFTISEGATVLFDSSIPAGFNDYIFGPMGNTVTLRYERLDLGTDTKTFSVEDIQVVLIKSRMQTHCVGGKTYELSDHLGNVRAVISDKRNSGSTEVVAATDYYPFGMEMSERIFSSPKYRYGFNGMEKDDEMKDLSGSSYDFGARIYDSRLGRWLAIDPLFAKYPDLSPYNFVAGMPIISMDPDGEVIRIMINGGNTNDADKVMAKLQTLTNDKIEYDLVTEGNKSYYTVKITALNTENSSKKLTTGSNLIKHLVHTDVDVDISTFTKGDIRPGTENVPLKNSASAKNEKEAQGGHGSGSNIFIDENAEAISLGHELIHAEINAIGEKNREIVPGAEDQELGEDNKPILKKPHISEIQTRLKENELRKEQKLKLRPEIKTNEDIKYPVAEDFYEPIQNKISE